MTSMACGRAYPVGPYVFAHTNLTEIDAALSLFRRNNISPNQVNLGLAFYGRSFTLLGFCSNTPGILTFIEIAYYLSAYTTIPSLR